MLSVRLVLRPVRSGLCSDCCCSVPDCCLLAASFLYFSAHKFGKISCMHKRCMNRYTDSPSKFFLALQSYCCCLSVVLLSCDSRSTLIRRDRTKKFGRERRRKRYFIALSKGSCRCSVRIPDRTSIEEPLGKPGFVWFRRRPAGYTCMYECTKKQKRDTKKKYSFRSQSV